MRLLRNERRLSVNICRAADHSRSHPRAQRMRNTVHNTSNRRLNASVLACFHEAFNLSTSRTQGCSGSCCKGAGGSQGTFCLLITGKYPANFRKATLLLTPQTQITGKFTDWKVG